MPGLPDGDARPTQMAALADGSHFSCRPWMAPSSTLLLPSMAEAQARVHAARCSPSSSPFMLTVACSRPRLAGGQIRHPPGSSGRHPAVYPGSLACAIAKYPAHRSSPSPACSDPSSARPWGLAGGGGELAPGSSSSTCQWAARFVASWHFMPNFASTPPGLTGRGCAVQCRHGAGIRRSAGWGTQHLNRLGPVCGIVPWPPWRATGSMPPRRSSPCSVLALFKTSTFAIGIWGNLFARLGSGAMPVSHPALSCNWGFRLLPSKAG